MNPVFLGMRERCGEVCPSGGVQTTTAWLSHAASDPNFRLLSCSACAGHTTNWQAAVASPLGRSSHKVVNSQATMHRTCSTKVRLVTRPSDFRHAQHVRIRCCQKQAARQKCCTAQRQAHSGRARMKNNDDIPSDLHRTYPHKMRKSCERTPAGRLSCKPTWEKPTKCWNPSAWQRTYHTYR